MIIYGGLYVNRYHISSGESTIGQPVGLTELPIMKNSDLHVEMNVILEVQRLCNADRPKHKLQLSVSRNRARCNLQQGNQDLAANLEPAYPIQKPVVHATNRYTSADMWSCLYAEVC